jgi:hypothetical protein
MSKAATLFSISEIFENRFFKIPDYQRGYSWEEEQLVDLRKDIENLYSKSHKHFTGTIVAAKSSDSEEQFDIVDGQQRVTTLIILLKEIYKTDTAKYVALETLFFKRGAVGSEKNVLTPNEETRVFFNDLILGTGSPEAKIKSHYCIASAQIFFHDWLKESPENPDRIYAIVANWLGFILFTPNNDKEIGIMFEVINNRGKKLSELEKIKNYFIYFSTIHDKDTLRITINDKWREIQENLSLAGKTSNEDENSFLRFAYIIFYEANKEKSHAVYEQMKLRYSPQEKDAAKINTQVEQMQKFVSFLADASRNYTYFFRSGHYLQYSTHPHTQRIEKSLTYLRCHYVNASVMPLYLAVMNSFNQPQPSGFTDIAKRVADLLELIEIANFRLYVLPGVFARADTKQGDMFYYANEFYRVPTWTDYSGAEQEKARFNWNVIHQGNIYDWLETELTEMILNQCPLKKFVEVLTLDAEEEYDYYNWRDGLRFFLSCYEEKKKSENGLTYNIERMLKMRNEVKDTPNEYLSIEHIWARENLSDIYKPWQIEKRRLGNLVLMGLSANISQQDDDIPDKVDRLITENHVGRGSLDLHQIAELDTYLQNAYKNPVVAAYSRRTHNYYRDLAIALCDLREQKLIDFALERWGLPGENKRAFLGVDTFNAVATGLTFSYQFHQTGSTVTTQSVPI